MVDQTTLNGFCSVLSNSSHFFFCVHGVKMNWSGRTFTLALATLSASRGFFRSSTAVTAFVPHYSSLSCRSTPQRVFMATKPGVSSPQELLDFVQKAGDKLVVVDVRNPDPEVEPGDQKSLAVASLPSDSVRPRAMHLVYDRNTESMPLPDVPKDTPIITHCGGGGRGQKAKEFLQANGFVNVLNGGGPKETECWAVYGDQ